MNEYEYSIVSGWKTLDRCPLKETKEEWFDDQLKANGYICLKDSIQGDLGHWIGTELGWSVRLYSHNGKTDASYPFIVEVADINNCGIVFCPDFLSAVELAKTYAPLAIADILHDTFHSLEYRLKTENENSDQLRKQRWQEIRQARQRGKTG